MGVQNKWSVFILLVFGISCKVEPDVITPCMEYSKPVFLIKEIKTITEGDTSISRYYYDELSRIHKRVDFGKYRNSVTWQYTNDKVMIMNGVSVWSYFEIDSNGYATTNSLCHCNLEYDKDGYLKKETEYSSKHGTSILYYNYNCWNNDKIIYGGTDLAGNKIGGAITYNSYYFDKINTIGNENLGMYYLGKQNNCLIKSSVITNNDYKDTLSNYYYEIDTIGRVIREIEKNRTLGTVIRIYTYY